MVGCDESSVASTGRTTEGAYPRPNGDRTYKYTYKDIVYIVNNVTGEEVTSYAVPVKLDPVRVTPEMKRKHVFMRRRIQAELSIWTSNSVLVVDRSGSMRAGDIWGSRNRLSSVWLSVALDFLAHRLESGCACETDVISIVTLEETPVLVVEEEPCTWVLYNKLVALHKRLVCHDPLFPVRW